MAPLGIQIGVTTGSGINRPLSSFSGILDTYTDAVSGYSVRKLLSSATKSMKVRRSSDSNYQDIGFDSDGNLDTTTLLSFINAEKDIFTSDFPNGTSAGSGDGELGTTRTSLTAPSSIGGQTDALKITCDGSTQHYDMRVKFMEDGQKHNVSFEYYIPSGNSVVGGIRLEDFTGSVKTFTTADAWTSVTLTDEVADNTILRFFAANSSGSKNIGSGVTESFYIRNLSVSQTTADGTVNILYDQTGNNDLSNGSASQQPKIVEAGSVVTKGGQPAIKFNNVEYLQKESASTSWVSNTNVSIFSVFSCVDFQHSSEATKDTLYNISGNVVSSGNGSTLGAAARSNQLRIGFFNQSSGGYEGKQGLNTPPNDTQILVSSIYDSSSTLTTILNASTNGTVTSNPEFQRDANKYTLGANHAGAKALDGTIQEFIIWNEDQTDNRGTTDDGIAGNMNTYFDIY